MRNTSLSMIFLSPALTTAFPLFALPDHARSYPVLRHVSRQVGDGVNGNQTGNNGSTGGTGLGDGNGVGFAGTGNDIDTGDDFDIGDGNVTMGDGNQIAIGDRIININIPQCPSSARLANETGCLISVQSAEQDIRFNVTMRWTDVDNGQNQ